MSAKCFALACSAVGALMTAAPAQLPPPELLPAPRPVATLPQQPLEAPQPTDRRLQFLNMFGPPDLRPTAPAGARLVVAKALCVRVPADAIQVLGSALTDGKGGDGPWVLTPREARMLAVLLGSALEVDILSRPQLCLTDEQTGFFQVGQQVPVVSALRAESKDGADVYTAQVTTADVGITLRTTPKVSADGRSVLLRVEAESRETTGPALPVVPVGFVTDQGVVRRPATPAEVGVGLSTHSVQATVKVSTGETVVMCSTGSGTSRVVWLITPHVVGGEPTPTPIPAGK